MVHAGFHHAAARHLQLAHQFHANGAAGGSEMDALQERAPDQAVIAIDIADADAEQQPRAEVVRLVDSDEVSGVVAFQLVAVDEARRFHYTLLTYSVVYKYKFLGRRLKPAEQRAALAAIPRVRDHAKAGAI